MIILKQENPLMVLLCFRATACSTTGYCQWGIGSEQLSPPWKIINKNSLTRRQWNSRTQRKGQTCNHLNCCHRAMTLAALRPDNTVFTNLDHEKIWSTPAVIFRETPTPRSYLISTQQGTVLRWSCHPLWAESTLHLSQLATQISIEITEPL